MNIRTNKVVLVSAGLAASSVIAGCGSDNATGEVTAVCGDGTQIYAKTRAEQKSECASRGGVKRYLAPPEIPGKQPHENHENSVGGAVSL